MQAAETGLQPFKLASWRCEGGSRDTWSLEGPGNPPIKSSGRREPLGWAWRRGRREHTMRLHFVV